MAGPAVNGVWCGAVLVGAVCVAACAPARSSSPATATASGPLAAPRVTSGDLDAVALLGELPARASRVGAGPFSLVARSPAVENDWVGGFVDVPPSDCLLGYARGAQSIDDVDIAAFSEEGTSLAVDEGRDVHPTVVLCAPHPDRVYLAAHVVEGEGLVAVGAQLVHKDRAELVARALGARGVAAEGARPADGWPGLADAVRTHRGELGGAWDPVKRVAVAVDARVPAYVALSMDPDQCLDAVVVPDDDVAMLDVEAIDGEGRVVARAIAGVGATGSLGVRTLTLCSPIAVAGTLMVRPHLGRGAAAVDLARARGDVARDLSTRPEVLWIAPAQPLEKERTARDTLLAKNGYEPPMASTSGALVIGRRVSVPVDLKRLGGACGRIDVVAGAPLALVDARMWDDAGALLAAGRGAASLALFACAPAAAHVELEAEGRPGPFAITLRPERWRNAAFAAHPLAASRMLARAASGPEMLLDGKEASARALPLDAAHSVAWTEEVAAGKCVAVAVGAQGDGAGVELRAFSGDEELDRSEAAYDAEVKACARPEAALAARFELRVSAGKMDAVVGERVVGRD